MIIENEIEDIEREIAKIKKFWDNREILPTDLEADVKKLLKQRLLELVSEREQLIHDLLKGGIKWESLELAITI